MLNRQGNVAMIPMHCSTRYSILLITQTSTLYNFANNLLHKETKCFIHCKITTTAKLSTYSNAIV